MDAKTLVLMEAVLTLTTGLDRDAFVDWKDEEGMGNIEFHCCLAEWYDHIAPGTPHNAEPYDVSDAVVAAFRAAWPTFPSKTPTL